jgi:hypothetical protein
MEYNQCRDFETRDPPKEVGMPDEHFNHFVRWTECLVEWCERVREDILRIEEQLGMEQGDPGPPPRPPWRPKGRE